MVRVVLTKHAEPDALIALMERYRVHPDVRHYDRVIGGQDMDVYTPSGRLLMALRVRRVSHDDLWLACDPLVRAAKQTNYRAIAAGRNRVFLNNVAGALDGKPTAFTRDRPQDCERLGLLMRVLDSVYREFPRQYAATERAAARTQPDLLFPGTRLTTLTANLCATGVHTDGNNLDGGYAAMTAIRSAGFMGGLYVVPKYRIAVDLRPGDVLVVDNREYHGNTLFESGWRVSAVAYFHASNLPPDQFR